MDCPKCQGGSYLAEEELVKVLEGSRPLMAVMKATFVCRSCSERFTRLVTDSLEKRRLELKPVPPQYQYSSTETTTETTTSDVPEGLKFF